MIKDKRKIDMSGRPKNGGAAEAAGAPQAAGKPTAMGQPGAPAADAKSGDAGVAEAREEGTADAAAQGTADPPGVAGSGTAGPGADVTVEQATSGESVITGDVQTSPGPSGLGAELAALRSDLEERVTDLQRLSAEYANYRKRVERDRNAVAEQVVATVVAGLLPILDDMDRAREHGDLVGPFGAVAEQLNTALAKVGLTAFGESGDAFDPTRHEAVTHRTSADVTQPTCVEVMRRGYLLGERLLRAAMVAVADPE